LSGVIMASPGFFNTVDSDPWGDEYGCFSPNQAHYNTVVGVGMREAYTCLSRWSIIDLSRTLTCAPYGLSAPRSPTHPFMEHLIWKASQPRPLIPTRTLPLISMVGLLKLIFSPSRTIGQPPRLWTNANYSPTICDP
jgi:hypothetical protein